MGYVLAVPDSPAVLLLDHRRVVEAPRLLNVRRLQVVSHNHILLSGQRNRPPMTLCKHAARDRRLRTVHSFPWRISRVAIPPPAACGLAVILAVGEPMIVVGLTLLTVRVASRLAEVGCPA